MKTRHGTEGVKLFKLIKATRRVMGSMAEGGKAGSWLEAYTTRASTMTAGSCSSSSSSSSSASSSSSSS
ncbi:hypothetical protein E2C01_100760 [Portunus trituberculatus]|uniref:Uncharacterized protein n=1 Tax=Portunus trituberculatus TaxID=210409 RepID=A0A5B7KIQ8_PORTR|nr:hypothetical protein [Portunus trituberculatus]